MGSPAFIFLCKLAWAARYRIPIIISLAFVAFDIRMQVEINVQMRTVRQAEIAHEQPVEEDDEDDEGDWSDDSWTTIDEDRATDTAEDFPAVEMADAGTITA